MGSVTLSRSYTSSCIEEFGDQRPCVRRESTETPARLAAPLPEARQPWAVKTRPRSSTAQPAAFVRRLLMSLTDLPVRLSRMLPHRSMLRVDRALALADRCPAAWSQMVGGWVRDPLIERSESAREAFVSAARAAAPLHAPPLTPS